MNREQLQTILTAARARLAADQAGELARSGLPNGVAYLVWPLLKTLAAYPDRGDVSDLLLELVGKAQRRPLLDVIDTDLMATLRTLDATSEFAAACQALLAVLSDDGNDTDSTNSLHMRAGTITHSQQIVATNYYAAGADTHHEQKRQALIDYLRSVSTRCGTLDLGRMVSDDGLHRTPIRLEQVYIALMVRRMARQLEMFKEEDDPRRDREGEARLSVLTVLNQTHPARLVLLGDPGSGKSTFTNYLTLCMAGAWLGREVVDDAARGTALLEQLKPDWDRGPLLPLRIVLRDLAAYGPLAQAAHGDLALLHQYLAQALGAHHEALSVVTAALNAGKAMLIFDGLDEVVGDAIIDRVMECITAAAGTYTHSALLITCRARDYEEQPRYHLPGFQTERLDSFDDHQIERFITGWHQEFLVTGRQPLGTVGDLQRAVGTNDPLRELARQPLLLTMIAIVHAAMGKLPDSRAQLYHECIKLLLVHWRKEKGQTDVLSLLGLQNFQESDLLNMAARLGFVAHEQAERTPEQVDRPADLTRATLRDEFERAFAPYAPDLQRREALASMMLHQIADRNGLLMKQSSVGGEVYTFAHRTYQEFLAGVYLTQSEERDIQCIHYTGKGHWHEALKLMVSYQVLVQGRPYAPLPLIRDLVEPERTSLEIILAGELLALVGYERTISRPGWAGPTGRWVNICAQLRAVATDDGALGVPVALRVRAGMALGVLCYGSVATLTDPHTRVPPPDPRLLDPATGTSADGNYWCAIAPGQFWYGDETEGEELRLQAIDQPFQIARYTVTNAEFARFVADNGYTREEFWTPEGWKFLQPGNRPYDDQETYVELPRYWEDGDLNNPLQPVVGISWYEAAAYCKWLTDTGHGQGWLPKTEVIWLPTSLEWERAARHTDQRPYPWGDTEPTPEHANYDVTNVEYTTPIGCFPQGMAECGALDMAGNVSEWLVTLWDAKESGIPIKDFTPDQEAMLTYSYYGCDAEQMRCGSRYRDIPCNWSNFRGFRVLRSLRSLE
jgi:formylglycine-generating enzyme required for sulfatase activity